MIKARIGEDIWLLGLSEENLTRLRQGKTITVDFSKVAEGKPAKKIIVMYGKTEADMKLQLDPYIDANTRILGEEH